MSMRSAFLAAALVSGGFAATAGAQQLPGPRLIYTQPLAPSAVQSVQSRLRSAGDNRGRIDGMWGPDSVTALERFQQTHGLQTTGQLNPATVATLGVWGPETQNALARFQQGRGLQANGQLNPATVAALGMSSGLVAERPTYQARHYAGTAEAGSPNCGTPYHWKACAEKR
ncbi:MAG TPA: peptidoglycan-binding domain-containing protein [Acetobacteraceae bacterium]|nr:peptidoglycan-binding domain-containing protein [Acetobacteraceae bacterium]